MSVPTENRAIAHGTSVTSVTPVTPVALFFPFFPVSRENLQSMIRLMVCLLILLSVSVRAAEPVIDQQTTMPGDFVYLSDVDPTITQNLRYHTANNFMGRQVPGYAADRIVCTRRAAEQLKLANDYLKTQGYQFVIYDAYRPLRAVAAFRSWAEDTDDIVTKPYFYPTHDKADLFRLGYIAERFSGHSRGSTFDLTLIATNTPLQPVNVTQRLLKDGTQIAYLDDHTVDMGSSFDLLQEASHHDSPLVAQGYLAWRNYLRAVMRRYGFNDYAKEWWHYTLADEPYPNTYFDFVTPADE